MTEAVLTANARPGVRTLIGEDECRICDAHQVCEPPEQSAAGLAGQQNSAGA